jgi:two-component system response regulator AgrA
MLKIYTCEDDKTQRDKITSIIKNYLLMNDADMEFASAFSYPDDLLKQVDFSHTGLYFLDIDYKLNEDGFSLAQKIRERDPRGFIVIVTTHSEMLPLTFQYLIEPLDFIAKDDIALMSDKIKHCIDKAYELYSKNIKTTNDTSIIELRTNSRIRYINTDEIISISVADTPHKIDISLQHEIIQIRDSLKTMKKQLSHNFVQISRETIINIDYIQEINTDTNIAVLKNNTSYQISLAKSKDLKSSIKAIKNLHPDT